MGKRKKFSDGPLNFVKTLSFTLEYFRYKMLLYVLVSVAVKLYFSSFQQESLLISCLLQSLTFYLD